MAHEILSVKLCELDEKAGCGYTAVFTSARLPDESRLKQEKLRGTGRENAVKKELGTQ